MVPPLVGIIINSVNENQKASAYSISNLLQNLIGYLPAPGLYGFIAKFTNSQKWAMGVLMYSTLISIGFCYLGIKLKLENDELNEMKKDSSLHNNQTKSDSDNLHLKSDSV